MLYDHAGDFFANSPVLMAPVLALGLFLVVFVLICVRAWRMPRRDVDHMSHLPLETDDE